MPQKLIETIKLDRRTKLNHELFIRMLTEIQGHLDPLEVLKDGLDTAIKRYSDFVRERTDLILGPKIGEIEEKLLDLTTMISTAQADLEAGSEHALDQIQPQITAKLAEVTTAISGLNTAISQANAARDGANTAAGAANTAAAGVNTAIADQIRGAEYFARWIAG